MTISKNKTTAQKTATKKATQEPVLNPVELIVSAYFNDHVSLNDTAMSLSQAGVGFTDIKSTIDSIGIAQGWILTPEKIKEKVNAICEGKVLSHFLDVVYLAQDLDLPQLNSKEKQQAIIEFSGAAKSDVKEPMKFKRLHNSGNHGNIMEWIKSHPDFTATELHNSGVVTASNKADYYDEVLAYMEFFRVHYGLDLQGNKVSTK